MAGLIHLFQIIFTYPALNLLIWCYHLTHNFALALMLLAALLHIVFVWSAGYMDDLLVRDEHYHQAMSTTADKVLYPWRHHFLSAGVRMRMGCLNVILSLIKIYLTIGLYTALPTLNGLSHSALNDLLYPFVPHLSALPDYTFALLGDTISLVQRNFPLSFLLLVALPALADASLRARATVKMEGIGNFWSKSITLTGKSFLINLLYALLLSWLLASGSFLVLAVENFLRVLLRAYVIKRSGV